jgi:hypothetical protein
VTSKDAFERSREQTDQLREELKDIRRDVEALVEDEVRRAADPARIEALVRQAVSRELTTRTPWLVTNAFWVGPLTGALVGLAIGLSAFTLVSVRRGTPAADAVMVAAADPGAAPESAPPAASPRREPAQLAARYDSLFDARAAAFDPLLRAVESSTSNEIVRSAIAAWRMGGMTAVQRERLHAALVQLALRDAGEAGITIDGGMLRDPCRGASCGALLAVWREQGERLTMPVYTATAAEDNAAVRIAERVLVLDRLAATQ